MPHRIESVAAAQGAEPDTGASSLTGTYLLAEPRSTAESQVNDAIEHTVSGMSFLIRGIARGRLRETNDIPNRVDISVSGDHVVVRYDDDPYEAMVGVSEHIVARGKPTELLVERNGPRLSLRYRTDDGEKLMVHSVSDDGRRMWMDVRVTSGRLPSPLTYRVPYRRA